MSDNGFTIIDRVANFMDIKKYHGFKHDMSFSIELNEYTHQHRVCLFKVGWKCIENCIVSTGQPVSIKGNRYTFRFSKDSLPKNEFDTYQLCYINESNVVLGTSPDFQFDEKVGSNGNIDAATARNNPEQFSSRSKNNVFMTVPEHVDELKSENREIKKCLETLISKMQLIMSIIADQEVIIQYLKDNAAFEAKLTNIQSTEAEGKKKHKQSPTQQVLQQHKTQRDRL